MWDDDDIDFDWPGPEYFPPSPRREGLNNLFELYRREYERMKEDASFEKTMREIELLPQLDTEQDA